MPQDGVRSETVIPPARRSGSAKATAYDTGVFGTASMMRFLLVWLLLVLCSAPQAENRSPAVVGMVESVLLDPVSGLLEIKGWTRSTGAVPAPAEIQVTIDGRAALVKRIDSSPRQAEPDQAEVGGVGIGFVARAQPAAPLGGGLRAVEVTVTLADGSRHPLRNAGGDPLYVHVDKIPGRHWILLGLVLAVIVVSMLPASGRLAARVAGWLERRRRRGYAILAALFCVLVGLGVTGSSLPILIDGPFGSSMLETRGSDGRVFRLRHDRTDEWGVLMPNVLAQLHHQPRFPIVNTRIGLEGQNMGVVGMTGAPVAQWAAVARPATWGYFFLPLRQAMSWHWQLSFFGGLLLMWAFLNRMLAPARVGRNLALAITFCTAPYAAVWSNWPLYASMFPLAAMLLAASLLQAGRLGRAVWLGLLLGLVLAGWVLVLYPPWLITVGSLCALLMVGWVADQRLQLRFGTTQWIGFALALLIAVTVLLSWWVDTRDAIALVRETVYPGARRAIQGGDATMLWMLRGYMGPEVITFGTGPWSNQSEAGSYFLLPFAVLGMAVWLVMPARRLRWTARACVAFILLYLWFQFIGFPPWLAQLTLWGQVPLNRMDIGLGLAVTVLVALLGSDVMTARSTGADVLNMPRLPALILCTLSAWLVLEILGGVPVEVMPRRSLAYAVAVAAAAAFICWSLLRNRVAAAIGMVMVLGLVATVGFNPLSRAPRGIEATPAIHPVVFDASGRALRTLVVGGSGIGPMTLVAAGVPTINGVLYYPHKSLWRRMGLAETDWPVVNRYQHLGFTTNTPVGSASFSVRSQGMDHVWVDIDPAGFDFSAIGAERVVGLGSHAAALARSPQLREIGRHGELVWFSVARP